MCSDCLSRLMERVEQDVVRTMERERSAHEVLHKVIREATPALMAYKTRGRIPPIGQLEEIAVKLLAIVAASESADH